MDRSLRSGRARRVASSALLAVWLSVAASAGGEGPAPLHTRVESSIGRATGYLASQIGPKGMCKGEYGPKNARHGGKTALCIYALLTARTDHRDPVIQRGLNWLSRAKLHGVYAVAMRACAYSALKDRRIQPLLISDVQWLIKAAGRGGKYTYTSLSGGAADEYDNSNGLMAVLGVWAGANRGVEVPAQYWQMVERHWRSQQQSDGGWPYFVLPNVPKTRTYGSMTAGGLAAMYICFDLLRRDEFLRCTASSEYKPILDGLGWMGKNLRIRENPRKGLEWYYYWLYCLERAAMASGRKYFGGHDWYAGGAAELLGIQRSEGNWGDGPMSVVQTSFATLFLARGRDPVLLNKLRYKGKWNARPRDASNLARYVRFDFERPATWQVVDLGSPLADWHDAPLMYISGAGPCEMTDAQIAKLRTYVQQGGTIVSEAACNNGSFTLDIEKIYRRMFPRYPLRRLAESHPIYSFHFRPQDVRGLSAVTNGVRLLAIHSPREISLALQMGPQHEDQKPWFQLAANMYLYATDRGRLRPRGQNPWPVARKFLPVATIRLARLKYSGNYDPEPLAWPRMAILMGNRHRIKLDVDKPMPMTDLDATKWPVAVLTGTGAFPLTPAEGQALRQYVVGGGTLIVDSAGGGREFHAAVRKQVVSLFANAFLRRLASHVAARGPAKVPKVLYRSFYASTLGAAKDEPQLWGVMVNRRLAVILSPADLTAGLVGVASYRLRGYTPDAAVAIMTNLLHHATTAGK